MDEDDFFTTEELARKLKANTETVRRLIRTGKIAAIKLGNNYRVPAAEYERFATPKAPVQKPRTQRERITRLLGSL